MRRVALVIVITFLTACSKKQPEQYLLHPRARTLPAAEPDVRPRQRYDFKWHIDPQIADFRNHYRNPEKPAVRISGDDARLTPEARKAHVSGVVILEIAIDAKGRPTHWATIKPLPFGLTKAAVDAVRTWRFKPAMHHGRAVPVIQNVTVRFDPAH